MGPLAWTLLGLLALVILFFALIGFLYLTRGTPVAGVRGLGKEPPAAGTGQFREALELLTHVRLRYGHEVEILRNGDETYPRLWADIESARHTLTLQLYYCQPGRMADELKRRLIDRARAGVRILFLHDAFGSAKLKKEWIQELCDAGVHVAKFRPTSWYNMHKAQHRSHIRVVVVDGRVAWTGGFGIDDKWYGDGRHEGQWRDTNFRFTGPAARQHQATFVAGWAEATGELLTGDPFFPGEALEEAEEAEGGVCAGAVHFAPTIGSTGAERGLAIAITGARKSLYIANAYFVPDDDFRRMLVDAAKRGVDVRILAAGPEIDVQTTRHAGRARYEELLEGGVRIWEYQPSMMHAKTLVADGLYVSGGTMNFDNRSMAFNDESNLIVLDEGLAKAMEAMYLEDLTYAEEVILENFRKRPWGNRLNEKVATMLSRVL